MKILNFRLWTFSFLVVIHSPFWTFYTFWNIFYLDAPLKAYFDLNEFGLPICLRRGRGSKLCLKGPNESLRHLQNTYSGALNNSLQNKILLRELFTHLIEEGGEEESGKET